MSDPEKTNLKVVARLRDGNLVKGYMMGSSAAFEDLLQTPEFAIPDLIGVQPLGASKRISVPLDSLKALFFVKSFDGNKEHPEVKFFDKGPPIRGLWVRVKFYDDESLEGVIANSLRYLVEPGFLMKPPDPHSNNEILYVIKASLTDFRILGVRHDY
jgi:hypothetical protein